MVCYDMPGIQFKPGIDAQYVEPEQSFVRHFNELLEAGFGFVFLHHAIVSWPAWDTYAETIGGRWQYKPGNIRGVEMPDSGFRMDTEHRIRVLKDHPVTRGLPEEFQLQDELYLQHVFEDSIEPLLASDFEFTDQQFNSASLAVREQRVSNEGWQHPPGSNIVGWTRTPGNNRIVYLQSGHDEKVWNDPNYQLLLGNAIRWAADRKSA